MSSSRLVVALILAAAFAVAPVAAQRPSPEGGQPQQKEKEKAPAPLVGELVTVDTNARTFAIKTAAEGEVKFSYTEATEIIGAEKGASGLAAKPGAEVTVHYDSHGTARVATRIEVKPKT
jgi:hypothetical protein